MYVLQRNQNKTRTTKPVFFGIIANVFLQFILRTERRRTEEATGRWLHWFLLRVHSSPEGFQPPQKKHSVRVNSPAIKTKCYLLLVFQIRKLGGREEIRELTAKSIMKKEGKKQRKWWLFKALNSKRFSPYCKVPRAIWSRQRWVLHSAVQSKRVFRSDVSLPLHYI